MQLQQEAIQSLINLMCRCVDCDRKLVQPDMSGVPIKAESWLRLLFVSAYYLSTSFVLIKELTNDK